MNTKLFPLALLAADDGETVEGITRFQKLVFLAQRELFDKDEFYTYEPHKYGPFSKSLYDDLDQLAARDFVNQSTEETVTGNERKVYTLSQKGKRALKRAEQDDFELDEEKLSSVMREYNSENLWDLLDYVYSEYPEMTTKSKLKL